MRLHLKHLNLIWASNVVLTACLAEWQHLRGNKKKARRWHVPTFFNMFSEGESTYDSEADFGNHVNPYVDGWEPSMQNPYEGNFVDPSFFHESPGGGPTTAWQTHYPTADTALPWTRKGGGSWKPTYSTNPQNSRETPQGNWFDEMAGTGSMPAGWFDAAIDQAFNGNTEQARNCKLSVYVKPTDFEQRHSTEAVEFISVNGNNVSWQCRPRLSGCNVSVPLPFYPCVQDLPLEKLITSQGTLELSAKISETVDECPYEGSLLYAVPIVTCLVTEQVPAPYFAHNNPRVPETNLTFGTGTSSFDQDSMQLVATAPLKCPTRGCIASVLLALNSTAMTFSSCSLTIKVNSTDFDNLEWPTPAELLQYVRVEGSDVATSLNPSANPCRQASAGTPMQPSMIERTVVNNADVTSDASDGVLLVEAKITTMVDECAMQGNLLDGIVTVTCAVSSVG